MQSFQTSLQTRLNLRDEIPFKGVGLSWLETCEFRKILKLLFLKPELARDVAFMLPYIVFLLLSALVSESI
jgi:hypothetical protein